MTNIKLKQEDIEFLEEFNDFQLQGRYPDYMMKIYKICSFEYSNSILDKVKTIRTCLQENLQ